MCIFISLNLPWNHHPIEMACIIIVQAAPFGITNLNKGMGCNTWKEQPVKSFFLRSGWNLVIITLLQTTKDIKREDLRFLFGPSIENQDFMYPLSQLPNFPAQHKSLAHMICSRCTTEALSPTWSWRHGGCGAAGNSGSGELWHGHGRCHWAPGGIKGDMGISGSPKMDTSKNKNQPKRYGEKPMVTSCVMSLVAPGRLKQKMNMSS